MTGFFSRILARAHAPAAQIEPTVAPLFAAVEADTPSQVDTAPTTERRATAGEASQPHWPLPEVEQAQPAATVHRTRPAVAAPIPVVPEPRGRDTDALDSALSARIDTLLALAGRVRQPLADAEPGDARTLTLREVVHRTERITVRDPVVALPSAHVESTPPRPAPVAVRPREAAPVVRRPEIAPVVHAATTTARGDLAVETSPVVRINIGRIEVRAGTSAAPPAAPRPPAPKTMGLDEYLASRDGRGGR
jgi:hypothetical protein